MPNEASPEVILSRMKLIVEVNLRDPGDTQKQSLHSGRHPEVTLRRNTTFGRGGNSRLK